MARAPRAVLYARVSTRHQAQHNSVRGQMLQLEGEASHLRWRVVARVKDEGLSGADADRPGIQRVLDLVDRRKVDIVAVAALDRLGRSVAQMLEFAQHLRRRRVHLVSLRERIDTTTAHGRFFFTIFAALAEMERELAQERICAGLDAAREAGVRLGRPPVKLTPAEALGAYEEYGSVRAAAEAMGVTRATLHRRLKAAREGGAVV